MYIPASSRIIVRRIQSEDSICSFLTTKRHLFSRWNDMKTYCPSATLQHEDQPKPAAIGDKFMGHKYPITVTELFCFKWSLVSSSLLGFDTFHVCCPPNILPCPGCSVYWSTILLKQQYCTPCFLDLEGQKTKSFHEILQELRTFAHCACETNRISPSISAWLLGPFPSARNRNQYIYIYIYIYLASDNEMKICSPYQQSQPYNEQFWIFTRHFLLFCIGEHPSRQQLFGFHKF